MMRAFGILLIFCVFNVRSNSIVQNESSFSLRLIDVETNISPIPVLFLKKKTSVIVEGLGWLIEDEVTRKIDNAFVHKTNDDSRLIYSTFVKAVWTQVNSRMSIFIEHYLNSTFTDP